MSSIAASHNKKAREATKARKGARNAKTFITHSSASAIAVKLSGDAK